MNCREWVYLISSLLLLTLSNMGFAQFSAFFPPYLPTLGIRQEAIAPIFSAYTLAQLFASMFSGPVATRLGRPRVLAAGVGCVSFGSILFGLTPDICTGCGEWPLVGLFSLARAFQGTGGSLVQTVTLATLADAFPRSRARVLSSANSAGALAWTVGPPLGGILFANFGFRAPFVCSGIPPPLLLLLIRAVAPRDEEAGPGSPMKAKPPTRAELTSWLCAVSSLGLYMPAIASTVTSMKWTILQIVILSRFARCPSR